MNGWLNVEGDGDDILGAMGDSELSSGVGSTAWAMERGFAVESVGDGGESDAGTERNQSPLTPLIAARALYILSERARILEEWCERSLTDPEGRGVVLINDGPSKFYVGLDASVPFGTIHEYKSPPWGTEDRG